MTKLTIAEVEEMLRNAGFRVTEHRVAVLKAVAGARQAITVQALFDSLRNKYVIDQATIYRNLSALHEAGLIRRFDFNHGHAHYELETGEPSYKIVCGECETIEKLEGAGLNETMKKLMKKSAKFKKVLSHSVEVYGICKKCAA